MLLSLDFIDNTGTTATVVADVDIDCGCVDGEFIEQDGDKNEDDGSTSLDEDKEDDVEGVDNVDVDDNNVDDSNNLSSDLQTTVAVIVGIDIDGVAFADVNDVVATFVFVVDESAIIEVVGVVISSVVAIGVVDTVEDDVGFDEDAVVVVLFAII